MGDFIQDNLRTEEPLKIPIATSEITARFYESRAMTLKYTFCHCEEQSDEAILGFSTDLQILLFMFLSFTFLSSYTSIRHDNIVSGFVAPMPVLRPQILQLYDGYMGEWGSHLHY